MKKLILGLVLLLLLVASMVEYHYFSDPQRVCNGLGPGEVCFCTDDIPISACSVEKIVE